MSYDTILFPNLGITLHHVGHGFAVGGFEIAYYGVVIALAMLAGIDLAMYLAKRTGQDPDQYFNFAIAGMIISIAGARLYYVLFSLDYYLAHPAEIFDLRGGGLAIYGGVIAGVAYGAVYCRRKGMDIRLFLDTAMPAVTLGQAIGRWGNFFNREVFGGYTDSLLAMALPVDILPAGEVTERMLGSTIERGGVTFVQVHPTFLYESLWNLALLFVMLAFIMGDRRARMGAKVKAGTSPARCRVGKKFPGRVFCMYLIGYGLGRFWIEGIRTDRLLVPGTSLPVSQVLSAALVIAGIALWRIGSRRVKGV